MIRNSLVALLVAVASNFSAEAKSSQSSVKSGQAIASVNHNKPQLGATSQWALQTSTGNWGLVISFAYDLALGYTAELLSFVESDNTFLALNPIAFAEAYGEVRVKLSTGLFKGEVILDLKPFRVAPVDYQAAWNLNQYNDFCSSLSFTREVAQVEVRLATEIYECATGIYGYLKESKLTDCLWETYEPMLRAYNRSLFTKYDQSYDYQPWECVNEQASIFPDDGDFDDVIIIEGDGVFESETDAF